MIGHDPHKREGTTIAVAPTASPSTRLRIAATALVLSVLVLLLAGCADARHPPLRESAPPAGARAEIGVAYGATVFCPIPIELGGRWWAWDQPMGDWPPQIIDEPWPFSMYATIGEPHAVPGIVTLIDANTAVFRADVDGSEFHLTAHDTNPQPGNACL